MRKVSSDEYYSKYYNLVVKENSGNLLGRFIQLTHKTSERNIKKILITIQDIFYLLNILTLFLALK